MGLHGGMWGVVDGESTVRNWSINEMSSPNVFVASNTKGGTGRRKGPYDWNGNFAQYGGTPLKMPGDTFTFKGLTSPDDDTHPGSGLIWEGPAIVESLAVAWDWSTNAIINLTINFQGNGALVEGSGTLSDATVPDIPETSMSKIVIIGGSGDTSPPEVGSASGSGSAAPAASGSGSGGGELCVVTAGLTIVSALQSYINSCTGNWIRRKKGPIDWTGNFVSQEDARPAGLAKGDDIEMLWYVNAAHYWTLKWAHVSDFSGLVVDRETGAIIQQTVNLGMNGYYGGDEGSIRIPGAGSDWWPFT